MTFSITIARTTRTSVHPYSVIVPLLPHEKSALSVWTLRGMQQCWAIRTACQSYVILGATPTSSKKVGAAGVVDVDGDDSFNKEVAAAAASTATGTTSTRYKWPKRKEIFLAAPDDKLLLIVTHAIEVGTRPTKTTQGREEA